MGNLGTSACFVIGESLKVVIGAVKKRAKVDVDLHPDPESFSR